MRRWIIQKHSDIQNSIIIKKESFSIAWVIRYDFEAHLRALKLWKDHSPGMINHLHFFVKLIWGEGGKAWETSLPYKDLPNLKSSSEFLSKRYQVFELVFNKLSINQFISALKHNAKPKDSSVMNLPTSNSSGP